MATNIIMLASHNYSGSTDYNTYVERRKNQLLQENVSWAGDPTVKFIHFDVKNGQVKENRIADGSREWHTVGSGFTEISRSDHYDGKSFKSQSTNVLSITHVYDYLQGLGKTAPGSVKEFSIFGHSWHGGPLLVNSFQRNEYSRGSKRNERDPWDKDGRTKDFRKANMDDTYWSNLRRAFSPEGYVWVWGCLFSRAHYVVLNKLVRSPEYRAKRLGQHHENDMIKFSFTSTFATEYYSAATFFPSSVSTLKFSKTIRDVKLFLATGMLTSYPGQVAGDLGIDCYSALVGTYSIHETSSESRFPLMKIADGGSGHGANFTNHINFFKTYMNIEIDPDNRGYGKYTGSTITAWWNRYVVGR